MNFFADLPVIFYWYLIIFLLGLIFFPATSRLFANFADRGWAFSRTLGLVISGYLVWLLASLRILPFRLETIFFVLAVCVISNILIIRKNRSFFKETHFLKIAFFEEWLFLILLLLWSFVRGHEPSIHGLEKFMDFGFINAILNSSYFPPHDMWLAPGVNPNYTQGFFINYYYFGHFTAAFLTKLTQIPSSFTYNLTLANLLALSFTAAFSIGLNLFRTVKGWHEITTRKNRHSSPEQNTNKSAWLAGLLTAFLVTFAGNLHTIYLFTSGYQNEKPVPFWQIFQFKFNSLSYWYPNATRFIPNTIHEFPSYSWVVADLHGHVFDIPFVLLTLAILLAFIIGKTTIKKTIILLTISLMTAVMYMTNAWDGLIYLALTGLILLVLNYLKKQNLLKSLFSSNLIKNFAIVFIGFILFSLPFNLHFKPFVHGIGVVGGWELANLLGLIKDNALSVVSAGPFLLEKGNNLRSPIWMLLVLWGFFYLNILVYFLRGIRSAQKKIQVADIFLLTIIFLSTLLIIFPEFFYAKDIYPAHYRANTMFKLGYQAFIMLSILSGFTIVQFLGQKRQKISGFFLVKLFYLMPLVMVLIYPYFSVQSFYSVFANNRYTTLNGLNWLSYSHPDDYELINWLRGQLKNDFDPQSVVLEAVGESYTDYARISANTGLKTVLGWPVHEWLWRGSYDEPGKRVEEVRQIYEATDVFSAKDLLEKYQVTYLVIGDLEREKYPHLNENLLTSLGKEVFRSSTGKTVLIKLD